MGPVGSATRWSSPDPEWTWCGVEHKDRTLGSPPDLLRSPPDPRSPLCSPRFAERNRGVVSYGGGVGRTSASRGRATLMTSVEVLYPDKDPVS